MDGIERGRARRAVVGQRREVGRLTMLRDRLQRQLDRVNAELAAATVRLAELRGELRPAVVPVRVRRRAA